MTKKKKKRGDTRGQGGGNLALSPPRSLLSERLEQATGRHARTIFSGTQRCNKNDLERFCSMFNNCPVGISPRWRNPEEAL